jgi:hypothetical protein
MLYDQLKYLLFLKHITFFLNLFHPKKCLRENALFAYKKSHIFAKAKGCLIFQAEIKPYEPDAGNSVVGTCS